MAVDTVLLTRKCQIAAKVETTTGTAESLTASEADLTVFDAKFQFNNPAIARQRPGGFGVVVPLTGARSGTVSFYDHMTGNGAGAGQHVDLLLGCGFTAATNTYSCSSAAAGTLTIGEYKDGLLNILAGCMGNLKLTIKSGEPIRRDFNFTGVHYTSTATAMLNSITYPTLLAPRVATATITVGGTAYKWDTMEIDLGNQVILREDGGASVNGYRSAWITNREPTVTLSPESSTSKDWILDYRNGTTAALSIAVGASTGNMFTIAGNVALSDIPQIGDRNGIVTHDLKLAVIDDSLTITFA